jgi:hypothetical protein
MASPADFERNGHHSSVWHLLLAVAGRPRWMRWPTMIVRSYEMDKEDGLGAGNASCAVARSYLRGVAG